LAIKLFADDTNLFIFAEDESSVKRMAIHSIQALVHRPAGSPIIGDFF